MEASFRRIVVDGLACRLVGTGADEGLAEQDRKLRRHHPGERFSPLLERLLPQRLAVEEQQVEGVEHRALRAVARQIGLQLGEARASLVVQG